MIVKRATVVTLCILALLCFSMGAMLGAYEIKNGDFENGKTGFHGNFKLVENGSTSGKFHIQQNYKPGNNWNCIQSTSPVKCAAGETMKLSVSNKNKVTAGGVFLGIRFIRFSNGKPVTIGYKWQAVSNNVPGWTEYSMVFTTPKQTEAVTSYFRVGEDVKSGEVFWDNVRLEPAVLKKKKMTVKELKSAVFFKNAPTRIYDIATRKTMLVKPEKCGFNVFLNMEQFSGVELKTRICRGKKNLKEFCLPARREMFVKPGFEELQPGYYKLEITLLKNGKESEMVSKEIIIIKALPLPKKLEPVKTSSYDASGNILINGHPFVQIYFYHGPHSNFFGNNAAQVGNPKSTEHFAQMVKKAFDNGSYSWPCLYSSLTFDYKTKQWKTEALKDAVLKLKDMPGVIGFSLFDEPDGHDIPVEEVAKAYTLVKQLSPHKLVWTNLCLPDKFSLYSPYSDLASYDVYPFPAAGLGVVAAYNEKIKNAVEKHRPLLSCLQTYAPPGNPPVSYTELRAETYFNITAGMKLFCFYAWSDPPHLFSLNKSTELQSYVQSLIYEIRTLIPFLLAPTPEQPQMDGLSSNIASIFKRVDGRNWLIIVNMKKKAQKLEFILPDFQGETMAEQLFSAQNIVKAPGGRVEIMLEALGVRIFRY